MIWYGKGWTAELARQNKMGEAGRKGASVYQVKTASPSSSKTQPDSSQTPQSESSKIQ